MNKKMGKFVNQVTKKRMYKAKKMWVVAGTMGVVFLGTTFADKSINVDNGQVNVYTTKVSAAVINGAILSNIQTTNNATQATPFDKNKDNNVTFNISGEALAGGSIGNSNTKQAVLKIPDNLVGKVKPNGQATVETRVGLDVAKFSLLSDVITAVNKLVKIANDQISSTSPISINLADVNKQLDILNNLQNAGKGTFTVEQKVSSDGKYITVSLQDGLGPIIANNLTTALSSLSNAVTALKFEGSGLIGIGAATTANGLLVAPKIAVTTAVTALNGAIKLGGNIFANLADASVLGATSITMPETIQANDTAQATENFLGTVTNQSLIDVNLFAADSPNSSVFFKNKTKTATPTAEVTGDSKDGYTVSGTATPGSTVEVKNGGKTVGKTTVGEDGKYSVKVPGAKAGDTITVTTSKDGVTSDGKAVTVPEDKKIPTTKDNSKLPKEESTNGMNNYNVVGKATPETTANDRNNAGNIISNKSEFNGNKNSENVNGLLPKTDYKRSSIDGQNILGYFLLLLTGLFMFFGKNINKKDNKK